MGDGRGRLYRNTFSPSWLLLFHEHKGVEGDAEAAQEHGGNRNERGEQAAHCDGNADDIVEKREKQVLLDFFGYPLGQGKKIKNLPGFSPHEGDIRGLTAQGIA